MHPTQNNKKQNILITTGGTISTEICHGYLRPNLVDVEQFFGQYFFNQKYSPFCILSENLSFENLEQLCEIIQKHDCTDSNFIITAGTDNLAFMANYLAIRLCDIDAVVIIVSSDRPLSDKNASGHAHIKSAIMASGELDSGVYVVYVDACDSQTVNIHLGARVLPLRDFDGACVSGNNSHIGSIKNDVMTLNGGVNQLKRNKNAIKTLDFDKKAVKSVHLIAPHVGFDYNKFSHSLNERDIIVSSSYHSGTLKTSGENNINAIKNLCFVAGGKSGVQYESRKDAHGNIIFVDNIAPLALYIKVILSYNLDSQQQREFIDSGVANEFFGDDN